MKQIVENLKESWRLLRSDDELETLAAVVIVAWTVAPSLMAYYRLRKGE
jgi:hypothetical protein